MPSQARPNSAISTREASPENRKTKERVKIEPDRARATTGGKKAAGKMASEETPAKRAREIRKSLHRVVADGEITESSASTILGSVGDPSHCHSSIISKSVSGSGRGATADTQD